MNQAPKNPRRLTQSVDEIKWRLKMLSGEMEPKWLESVNINRLSVHSDDFQRGPGSLGA